MKKFKELFKEWTNEPTLNCAPWTLSDCENAALFIYEKMKEQYENVEGESFEFVVTEKDLQSIKAYKNVTLTFYKKGNFGTPIKVTIPKQKSKEEKVKDLLNMDLTESQWQVLEEIMKPREL